MRKPSGSTSSRTKSATQSSSSWYAGSVSKSQAMQRPWHSRTISVDVGVTTDPTRGERRSAAEAASTAGAGSRLAPTGARTSEVGHEGDLAGDAPLQLVAQRVGSAAERHHRRLHRVQRAGGDVGDEAVEDRPVVRLVARRPAAPVDTGDPPVAQQ